MEEFAGHLCLMLIVVTVSVEIVIARSAAKGTRHSLAFMCVQRIVMALMMGVCMFCFAKWRPSFELLLVCLVAGVFGCTNIYFYLKALARGRVTLVLMVMQFSVVIPILVSRFVFDEKLGLSQMVGMVLMVLAIVLMSGRDAKEQACG